MNLFNFVKSNLNIVAVIENYTSLKRAGHYYKAVCPFHYEKTASFTVSPHKDIFYCFGCQAGGDVINFIAKAENCSPLEATQFLIEQHNLNVPDHIKNNVQHNGNDKKNYHTILELTRTWLHENLKKSPAILRYLKDRGIDQNSINLFRIGFFPAGRNAINNFIAFHQSHNILVADLLKAQLLHEGKGGAYCPFEDRIMFPINDHLGRSCGFGGRIYIKDDTRVKYYNSHENEYFTKGSLLFGLDLAKKTISQQESVFLVEGYTDCIAMVQHGFANTVATLGTACTLAHLQQVARYARTLYVLYDGDQAGQKAILRLAEFCWQVDMEVNVIQLPPEEDPASFLKKGLDMHAAITQAQDIFNFFLATHTQEFNKQQLSKKIDSVRTVLSMIQKTEDQLKRDILLQKASVAFDIPIDSLQKEIKSTSKVVFHQEREEIVPEAADQLLLKIPSLEKKLFSAIINNVNAVQKDDDLYLTNYLCNQLQNVYKILKKTVCEQKLDFNSFFDALSDAEKQAVSNLMMEHQAPEDKDFRYLLQQFQKKNWHTMVADIKEKLLKAQQENNTNAQRELLQKFQDLKKNLLGHKETV